MSKRKYNQDINKMFTNMSDKDAERILKTQKPLTPENAHNPNQIYPHMNNLQADIYTNEAFKNFQQFSNFRNMGNIVFYKSANGKQLEVCFGNMGEVVWVESAHETTGNGGEEVPGNDKEDKNFKEEIEPPKDEQRKPITTIQTPEKDKQTIITPESKKTRQTKEERIKKTYENKTTFDKRIEKIKKSFDVKDKAVETYTKLARKTKNLKHPSKLIDTIKNYYSKFKNSKNKFNFFQKYKQEWERVKKAYNVKATLADLLEDLI